jgi:hypothetical protein
MKNFRNVDKSKKTEGKIACPRPVQNFSPRKNPVKWGRNEKK